MSDGNLNSENPYLPVQIPVLTRVKNSRSIYVVATLLVLSVHTAQYVYLKIYHDLRVENGTIMFDVHSGPSTAGGPMVFSHSTYSTNFFSAAAAIMISVAFVNFVIWSMIKWFRSRRAKPELN